MGAVAARQLPIRPHARPGCVPPLSEHTDPDLGNAPDEPTSASRKAGHFVYVLRCADGSLYAGYSTDVCRRLAEHQSGRGAKYTRSRRPVEMVAWWPQPDRPSALQAEAAFKRLRRAQKLDLLAKQPASPPDSPRDEPRVRGV